jgi:TolB-like protein/Tfp pilus assembly protein PilF
VGGRGAAAPPAHSIAVLPLANLSGQPSEDYFSDGLSEELINALARLKPLEVVARTSAFRFKGSKAGAKEIGAKLGVAYILDGSVRRDGTLVRISTTLAEARTGFERWSQTFDRELKDILAVQSEIAQAVAEALKVRLLGADIAAFSLGGAANAEAYDAYLRGRRLFDRGGSEANYRAALAQFDTAIAADPAFSAAHAARARALMSIANQYTPPERLRATFDASLKSARRAVALTPDLAEAQATLAGVLTNANFDFAGAKAVWARAMVTGSGDADILYRYGQFSCEIGDFGPGLPAVRRATVLDPLNPRAFRALGYALFGARLYTETIAAMRQSLALSPSSEGAHAAIADALMLTGDLAGAGREYALEPLDWLRLTGQAILRRRMGDAPGAEAALKALMGDDAGVTLYQQAQVYAQWGQTDRALTALEVAYKGRDSGIVLMKADPMVDPLRREPRFIRLLGQLGLA